MLAAAWRQDTLRETGDPLIDPANLQRFLRAHRLPPLDRFGQHVLVDGEILRDIVNASETDPTIPVVEIGAGLGVLTRALAGSRQEAALLRHPTSPVRGGMRGTRDSAGQIDNRQEGPAPLIAVEIDRRLVPLLRERVREFPAVRVVQADILKISLQELLQPNGSSPFAKATGDKHLFDVVGNIPYNITAPIINKFLVRPPRPRRMTLLADEAVASVIASKPPHMSLRSVSVQVYARPVVVGRRIPPVAFVPEPAVHSAILTLRTYRQPLVSEGEERAFFRLVRAGFSQKRKILANALSATYRLTPAEAAARLRRAGLDPSRRAQTLAIAEWKRLLRAWEGKAH